MKKFLFIVGLMLTSCGSTKHKCDAYSDIRDTENFDISQETIKNQEKYSSYTIFVLK